MEGEVGKVIFQSGKFGLNQTNVFTWTQCVLQRDHRIRYLQGRWLDNQVSWLFQAWLLMFWVLLTGTYGVKRVEGVGFHTASSITIQLLTCFVDIFHWFIWQPSIVHLLHAFQCSQRDEVIMIKTDVACGQDSAVKPMNDVPQLRKKQPRFGERQSYNKLIEEVGIQLQRFLI